MEDVRKLSRLPSFEISEVALQLVMGHIDVARDRDAISRVCQKWHRMDSETRKHVTIALCYSISPDRLCSRFPKLESLRLKGKPRASMFFNLIPEDWGGYASPWVKGIAEGLTCLKSVHFRRMIVTDSDIGILTRSRGQILVTVKLDKCSGFSTDGLVMIATSCRNLRTLFLEESIIDEKDGGWLHELALNCTALESLSFYLTELRFVAWRELEFLARNCRSLTSLKISESEISDLVGFFNAARALEEFAGGSLSANPGELDKYKNVRFPPKLCGFGPSYMGANEMHLLFPFAAALKKLDLMYTFLKTEDHCQMIQHCPNLEVLEVRDVIGDRGLEVVSQTCKRLRRLRIERGEDDPALEDEQGVVTQRGLSALAQGCLEIEYLAIYVSDITNAALECIGTFSKNLCDFRLVLLDRQPSIADLPIDNGVLSLLRGCPKIRRLALYLRPGGLTDLGLFYIGANSHNIRWMLLGHVGQSDHGLVQFSKGCPALQKLEMRGVCFSERALSHALKEIPSLRYVWVQGYKSSFNGNDLMAMARPFWNIEFFPPKEEVVCQEVAGHQIQGQVTEPAQILAYYSLVGRRTDCPSSVVPLHP